MLARSRPRRRFSARLHGVLGLLVAVGYLAGLTATTAGRGLALGAHVATHHADAPTATAPPADAFSKRGETEPTATPPVEAHDHAGAEHEHVAAKHSHDHAEAEAHGHGEHSHAAAPSTDVPPAPLAQAPPTDAAAAAVHEHGGRAHQHHLPEPPVGAPAPVALDKHRMPERPTLAPPPSARRVAGIEPADAWASAEGTVETPPPRARG